MRFYQCTICSYKPLELKNNEVLCAGCGKKYKTILEIFDFFYDEAESTSTQDYSVHFNREVLYNSSESLETRIKYFNERFITDLNCKELFDKLNSVCIEVLEVGCGTMNPLLPVGSDYNKNQHIYGIDISLPLLLRAKLNNPNTNLSLGNAASLSFQNSCFDLIWCRHMLYHVENASNCT